MQLDVFSDVVSDLHGPRQSAKIAYPLFDIEFLTVCSQNGFQPLWIGLGGRVIPPSS